MFRASTAVIRHSCSRPLLLPARIPLISPLRRLCTGPGGRSVRNTMPAAAAGKLSQGELAEAKLFEYAGAAPHPLVDIGANLADPAFDQDRDEVLARAARAGVEAIVMTGSSLRSSAAAAALAAAPPKQDRPALFFTAGVHPHEAKACDARTLPALRELAAHPRCVALGECGLDFNRNFSPPEVQERWFDEQVRLAVELRKPLFLHCRDAADAFARILARHELSAPAVVHCFTGSARELTQFVGMGLHVGITGWVCDDRPERGGAELASLLHLIPAEKLMLETDAPYLVPRTIKPAKQRPRRNEPALLPYVLHTVAEALQQDAAAVALRTTGVANSFFGLEN